MDGVWRGGVDGGGDVRSLGDRVRRLSGKGLFSADVCAGRRMFRLMEGCARGALKL